MSVHLIKLTVGCDTIADLAHWQSAHQYNYHNKTANVVHTRHMPKRADEMLEAGSSIYRVIKGMIACRQKITGFERYDTEEGSKTMIYTDTQIIRVMPTPRKAFQGWRYLEEKDAPADIRPYDASISEDDGSIELQMELRAAGIL